MDANTKLNALVALTGTVLEAIRAAGSQGIPDGHLYAMLQSVAGERWTLNFHQQVIGALVDAKKITKKNYLLVAV